MQVLLKTVLKEMVASVVREEVFGCIEALVDFGVVIFLCSLSLPFLASMSTRFNIMSVNVCLLVVIHARIVSEDDGSEGGIL